MLQTITLKNFALAKHVEITLDSGFNVITGETGAGKSLLLDALNLCTGARADTSFVRHGAEKAEIYAEFDISPSQIEALSTWISEQALEDCFEEDSLLVRRQIQASGRSKAWINGTPVSSAQLKHLGQQIVQMHSQHAQQALLKPSYIVDWLDNIANTVALKKQMQQTWRHYAQLKQQAASLQSDATARQDKMMLLSSKIADVAEVAELNYETLENEYDVMSNFEALMQHASHILNLLEDDESGASHALSQATRLCEQQSGKEFEAASGHLHLALSELTEAVGFIKQFSDQEMPDAQRLAELNKQLADFHRLSRKYTVKPQALQALYQTWSDELAELTLLADPENIEIELTQAKEAYLHAAHALNNARQKAAPAIVADLSKKLAPLALPNAVFEFMFTPITDFTNNPVSGGEATIALLFSANTGMPKQPLHKQASGGELSRIALVMQVMNARLKHKALMVFDEVDVGISGATAQILGQLLREMGNNQQILAITHQAQVAAQGHHHVLVEKQQSDSETQSHIHHIEKNERIDELARMSGGTDITDTTREHAKSLLAAVVS